MAMEQGILTTRARERTKFLQEHNVYFLPGKTKINSPHLFLSFSYFVLVFVRYIVVDFAVIFLLLLFSIGA